MKRYLRLIAGVILMAVAYKCIFDSAGMVNGGFSGLAIIAKHLFGIPMGLTTIVLNIPLFIVGYRVKGSGFIRGTVAATVLLSVVLEFLPNVKLSFGEDYLLVALLGGICSGVGIGLVVTSFATTGGTDMLAAILQTFFPYYSIAAIMQVLDGAIVLLGMLVFGVRASLYAFVAVYVAAKVSDRVIEGMKYAKMAYIISDHYEQIAQKIIRELERGGTYLEGRGVYSNNKKSVIMCVIAAKQVPELKKISYGVDERAFILITDVREAIGEGFVKNIQ